MESEFSWSRPDASLVTLRRLELLAGVALAVVVPESRALLWVGGARHDLVVRRVLVMGAALVVVVFLEALLRRQVRHRGYVETADAIVVTRGALFRSTTVIPYGRIQFLSVSAGPLARYLGLSTLRIGSASRSSLESIRGMRSEDVESVRVRLERRAQEKMRSL